MTMQTTEIAKTDWEGFFDRVLEALRSKVIEVDSLGLGARVEATMLPLDGLSCDPREDAFVVVSVAT